MNTEPVSVNAHEGVCISWLYTLQSSLGPEGMIEQGQERETQWEREESKRRET